MEFRRKIYSKSSDLTANIHASMDKFKFDNLKAETREKRQAARIQTQRNSTEQDSPRGHLLSNLGTGETPGSRAAHAGDVEYLSFRNFHLQCFANGGRKTIPRLTALHQCSRNRCHGPVPWEFSNQKRRNRIRPRPERRALSNA